MKRSAVLTMTAMAFVFLAGSVALQAQGTFKVPFKFEAGGKKFPSGEYWVDLKPEGQVTLRQVSTGKESQVPLLKKVEQPKPPVAEPQLVFDVVGNFEPSYTEYFTVYVLAEVWLPGQDGGLVHAMKGAHKTETVKGEKAKSMPVPRKVPY